MAERPGSSVGERLSRACGPKARGYEAAQSLQQEAVGSGGRATAIRCARGLLHLAAHLLDVPAGVRFARELTALEASSYSYLALGLAQERIGDVSRRRPRPRDRCRRGGCRRPGRTAARPRRRRTRYRATST